MSGISAPLGESVLFSPRTADYVSSLIREGDKFDYYKWLHRVREEEAEATQVPATLTSGEVVAAEIGNPINLPGFRGALPNCAFMTRTALVPRAIYRSHHEPGRKLQKLHSGGG
jgi:hypothetical protein